MQIRDIVNRDIVNLANCEHEPIHVPGSIQPHGFLLAVEPATRTIRYCSENVLAYTGYTPAEILSASLSNLLSAPDLERMETYLASPHDFGLNPFRVSLGKQVFECIMHFSGNLLVAEFELPRDDQPDLNRLYDQTKSFVTYIENAASLRQLCQDVAGQTRMLTGYDRVMIYKFDKDYNGEVFAESRREDLESFLGLHYPHTDIPVQARELYLKNLLRFIPDIQYNPVPVLTYGDSHQQQDAFDMGLCGLRSVSPIHIQYLQNMGVGGTLTISLIHKGRLWGLIACHHYSPHYLSHYTRISARLQGHFLASQISSREETEEYESARDIHQHLDTLLEKKYEMSWDSLEQIARQKEILDIARARGMALIVNDKIYTNGKVPAEQDIRDLAAWLHTHADEGIFYTEKLADHYPAAKKLCETAAGILYHALTDNGRDCILWFRPETLTEVTWAGDPEKAIIKDKNGLFPRKSFELWKQVVKCQSSPWQNPELNAVTSFIHAFQKQVHLLFLSEEEVKYRQLSIRLQEANAELENINWISTHDLKEPLRKIQVFASRMLEAPETPLPEDITSGIEKMRGAAQRMQTLLADILAYSRLVKVKDGFESVDINAGVSRVIEELKDEIAEKNAEVVCKNLPTINGIPFLVGQLFTNLIRNSLKFSKEGVPARISIEGVSEPVKGPTEAYEKNQYLQVTLKDNGIGFENTYNEEIFQVFVRLNSREEYTGSGVGLALCKKIMQNHEGFITASGKPGEGAEFNMYFPVGEQKS